MEYEIEIRRKSVLLQYESLEWNTEPPNERGYYFAIWVDKAYGYIEIVNVKRSEIYEQRLVAQVHGREINYELTSFSHWLGPIPMPDYPE